MAAPTNIPDAIEQNALGPKRVEVDGEEVEQHSIADQIAADQHLAAASAAAQPHFGLRFTKLVPPGAG